MSTHPFRTTINPNPQPNCEPDVGGSISSKPQCHHAMLEHAEHYDLLFAEFDDQGWLNTGYDGKSHPDTFSSLSSQNSLDNIRTYLEERRGKKLRIVTFVHGWKNNSKADNGKVEYFRRQLNRIALQEKLSGSNREVVGVFLGWRGVSVYLPEPLESIATFYDRKSVAHTVAKGAIHNAISYIVAYEKRENQGDWPCKGSSAEDNRCPVVTLFVGHSFGGLILFETMEPYILKGVISGQIDLERGEKEDTIERNGDLVVLLNPAIEASRFQPIFLSMLKRNYSHYQAPHLVMVTSTADKATGLAFPLGRLFDTLFETEVNGEQKSASLNTIGHMRPYLTHDLLLDSSRTIPPCEEDVSAEFRCMGGHNVLHHLSPPNNVPVDYRYFPVWNVRTDESIIASHGAIESDALSEFIVSLIVDMERHPKIFEPEK